MHIDARLPSMKLAHRQSAETFFAALQLCPCSCLVTELCTKRRTQKHVGVARWGRQRQGWGLEWNDCFYRKVIGNLQPLLAESFIYLRRGSSRYNYILPIRDRSLAQPTARSLNCLCDEYSLLNSDVFSCGFCPLFEQLSLPPPNHPPQKRRNLIILLVHRSYKNNQSAYPHVQQNVSALPNT